MTRIRAPELYDTKRRCNGFTPEREAILRAQAGIEPAILAMQLGLTERFVIMYQRKLGLRKCVPNYVKREDRV